MAVKKSSTPVSDDFLKNYIARNGKDAVHLADKQPGESTEKFLADLTADEPDTTETKQQKRLHKKAADKEASDTERDQRRTEAAERERIEAENEERQEQAQTLASNVANGTVNIARGLSNSVNPAIDKINSLPTVGGIGLLLLVIVILLFIVVQVNSNGDTRLKQVWYMLNGRASLQGSVKPTGSVPGQAAGSTTSTTGQTPPLPTIPPTSPGSPTGIPPILGLTSMNGSSGNTHSGGLDVGF